MGPVIVQSNPQRNVATLQLNNRVLMTVTQQDAQDFGLEVESLGQRWADALNIDYKADITTAKRIIADAVAKVEGVEPSQSIEILVRELAASTVNVEVRFRVNSRRLAFLEITSQAAQVIKESLMQAGIKLPTEIYTQDLRRGKVFSPKTWRLSK